MIELLIAFTAGVAAGMAIEAGVRRVEWRSVLRRRAKRSSAPRTVDEMIDYIRGNLELRPDGTDD